MRVLISGASGFIGSQIAARLHAAGGHQLVGLTRGERRGGADFTWVRGDVLDPITLRRALEGVDCVVHCAQFTRHPVEYPALGWTYLQVDGIGTCNLAEIAADAGVRRIVYLSGAGASAGHPQPWRNAKGVAEAAVRSSGLEWVILRPSLVYGPADRTVNRFVQLVRSLPMVPVVGSGRNRLQPIHVDDVARAAALSVTDPDAAGRTLELGGPDELTLDELLLLLQQALGTRKRLVHFPVPLVQIAAALLQVAPGAPVSPGAVELLLNQVPVDPRPAQDLFGFTFRELPEGLRYLHPGCPIGVAAEA